MKTVETHKTNGMKKLMLADRLGLVTYAVAIGWLTPENVPTYSRPPKSRRG